MNQKQVEKINEVTGLKFSIKKNGLLFVTDSFSNSGHLGKASNIKTLPELINYLPRSVDIDVDTIYVLLRNEKILPVLSEQELAIRKLRKLGFKKVKGDYGFVKAYVSDKSYEVIGEKDYQYVLKEEEIEFKDTYNLLLHIQKEIRGGCYY